MFCTGMFLKTDANEGGGANSYMHGSLIRGAVKMFPEMWYSTVVEGHTTTLTSSPSK